MDWKPNLARALGFSVSLAALALVHPAFAADQDAQSYVKDANKLLAKGDAKGAEIQLRNALRSDPDNPDIHIELAKVYLRLGNFASAEAEEREAGHDGGDDDEVAPLLAQTMLLENKMSQLLEQISPGTRTPRAEATVRLSLGLAHLALREYSQAEPLLADAVRLDPDSWRAKLALARLDMLKGDAAEAKRQIAEAAAKYPDIPDVLRLQGEMLRSSGDTAGALAIFDKILAKQPQDLSTLNSRANILISEGKLDDAQRDVDRALSVSPNNIAAIYLDALLMAKKGSLDKADDLLTKLSPAFTNLPSGYFLQATVKYALGQYEQAEASLGKYLARYPNQPAATRLLATIALRKNDRDTAISLLKPVTDANPSDVASVNLLARAYVAAGKKDEAVKLYEAAASAKPDDQMTQTSAALMQMRFGDANEGLADLEKIAGTDAGADIATPLLVLGDLQSGNLDKAAATAEAMVKRKPDDAVAQNLLGSVRVAQDKLPEAEAIFSGLIKSDPNFLAARRNLARVYLRMNRFDDSRKTWLDLLQRNSGDEDAVMGLADLAVAQQDVKGAVDWLTKARAAAPKDLVPGLRLAQLYMEQKDWQNAIQVAHEVEVQFPFNPRATDLAATARLEAGDKAGAAEEFSALTGHYTTSAPLFERYAYYQLAAGDKDGARASLQRAVDLAPDQQQYMSSLVKFDYDNKGVDAALATAKLQATNDPGESALLVAEVLTTAKRLPEAIDALTQANQDHPSGPIVADLATLYFRTGKGDQAKDLLHSWLKDHPGDVAVRDSLATMYLAQHVDDQAQAEYERVHAEAPADILALNNLSWLYAKKKDPRAHQLAERAYQLSPSPQTADTLGWVLVGDGEAGSGLPYIKNAAAALPADATLQYHLAAALNATGDKAEARSVLERVLAGDAAFDDRDAAQHLLDELKRG